MFTPSPPATSMSPAPAAAGAGVIHWLSMVSHEVLLMFVIQIFKADENTREEICEVEDFKASRIDGVQRNKRAKLWFRGVRRALILGFNSYPPKAYEITLPLINVERQQSSRKRPLEVDRATNYDNDSGNRWKGREGDLTGPLFAFVNCMFNEGCRVVEDVKQHTIGIYSPRTRCTFTVPPIPGLRTGIPLECQCVSLNGRLYVLGGLIPVDLDFPPSSKLYSSVSSRVKFIASSEVYVMDLKGGQRQWKTLPNMHDGRRRFGVGVCDEKIFVFGGEFQPNLWSDGCEVFDPKVNTWSRIRSMPSPRICHNVATIGEKLFVHAGVVLTPQSPRIAEVHDLIQDESPRDTEVYDPLEDENEDADVYDPLQDEDEDADVYDPLQDEDEDADIYDPLQDEDADVYDPLQDEDAHVSDPRQDEWRVAENWLDSGMDADEDADVYDPLQDEDEDVYVYNPLQDAEEDAYVYDPVQDEWRVAENWLDRGMDAVFVSDGRLHAMAENGIYQSHGVDRWEMFTEFGPTMNISRISSYVTEALDGIHGGLVTFAHWKDEEHGCGIGILQSSEFREQLEVHWELITFNPCPASFCLVAGFKPFFCRIVL